MIVWNRHIGPWVLFSIHCSGCRSWEEYVNVRPLQGVHYLCWSHSHRMKKLEGIFFVIGWKSAPIHITTSKDFLFFSDVLGFGRLRQVGHFNTTSPDVSKHLVFPGQEGIPVPYSFPCSKCDRLFTSYKARQFHLESVHEGQRFTCVCGKIYKYRTSLHKHMRESKLCGAISTPSGPHKP